MGTDTEQDAEKGGKPLHIDVQEAALAARKSRDVVVYLTIGWLFLVYTCVSRTYGHFL
jgi:hypothetical protein